MQTINDETLGNILSNKENCEKIKGLIDVFCSDKNKDESSLLTDSDRSLQSEKEQNIDRKIKIVGAVLPFLDERTRKKATIIIKVLEIVKIIDSLSDSAIF